MAPLQLPLHKPSHTQPGAFTLEGGPARAEKDVIGRPSFQPKQKQRKDVSSDDLSHRDGVEERAFGLTHTIYGNRDTSANSVKP